MDARTSTYTAGAKSHGFDRRTMLLGIGAGTAAAILGSAAPFSRLGAAQELTIEANGAYFVMRRYRLASGTEIAEVVRRTEESFLPIVREVPGFLEYLNVDLGDGEGATIGVFATRDGADESTERAAAWAREHLADLMQGPPDVLDGPVLLRASAQDAAGDAGSAERSGVIRQLLDAFNAGDLAALDGIVHPDFVDRTPLPGVTPDRAGLKQAVGLFREAFPDARWNAEDLVVEGDTVVARLAFRGTHHGELLGIPATGRPVAISGVAIYQIERGRIVEEWAVRDLLGLFQQLGVVTLPGLTGA